MRSQRHVDFGTWDVHVKGGHWEGARIPRYNASIKIAAWVEARTLERSDCKWHLVIWNDELDTLELR